MLDFDGLIIMVGAAPQPAMVGAFDYIAQRKGLVGSLIGGIKETQEMINFCSEKNISCDVEVCKPEQINEAYERVIKSDVKYRFSIDVT